MHEQLSQTIVVFFAFIGAIFAGITALVVPDSAAMNQIAAEAQASLNAPPVTAEKTVTVSINIMDEGKLRLVCLLAAMGGAVIGVVTFGYKTAKDLGLKLVGSSLIGMVFTPGLMRYFGIVPDIDLVLFWAPCVAIFGAAILKGVFPAVVFTTKSALARTFNIQFPPDDQK
jgi:hypothetical protein